MEKKIVAVVCAVIIMATLFASCGKKLYMQEINGIERAVVTNENGELITDGEGLIRVYETNTKGQIVTNKNGEPEFNYVQPPEAYVNGNKVIIENFQIELPDGYEFDGRRTIVKKGTDSKCYIDAGYAATVSAEQPYISYLDQTETTNREFVKSINDGNALKDGIKSAEMQTKDIIISGDIDAHCYEYKVYSTEDKLVHYAVSTYFLIGKEIYEVNYVCGEGVGYDENFDVFAWLENSVTVKK